MYLWQKPEWPTLTWDDKVLSSQLVEVARKQGQMLGRMESLGFELRSEARLQTLTEDVLKSSEIEGERLEREQVRSSIAQRLGMDISGLVPIDRDVDGVVEMMFDATVNYDEPLTRTRLFAWHASLFPTGRSGMTDILVGRWRDDRSGPMQVISGPVGRSKVHYEAPPATRIEQEMAKFLTWFNQPSDSDPLLLAGLAHLWFVTIHPFEDGNGRIARAIADMALARSENTGQRYYSMSAQIRLQNKAYYQKLESTQKGDCDVTAWQQWFLSCLGDAIDGAQQTLSKVLSKARFWERFATQTLNQRQVKVMNKMFDGFEGKLTTSKWAKLAKCSQDTAYRDILDLIKRGALKRDESGGRSTSYSLITD